MSGIAEVGRGTAGPESEDSLEQFLLFRAGSERFAIPLTACDEVHEWPGVERVPGMSRNALGVFQHRGRLLSVYTPERMLGAGGGCAMDESVVLVLRAGGRRFGLALDDVDEVIAVDMNDLRRPATREAADGLLLGVVWHGRELVAVLDVEALAAACMNTPAGENR